MSSTPPRFLADVFVPFSSIVGVGYRSLGVGERVTLPIEHPGQDTVTGHQPVPAVIGGWCNANHWPLQP